MGIPIGCPKLFLKGQSYYTKLGDWKDEDEIKADELTSKWDIEEDDLNLPDNFVDDPMDVPYKAEPASKKFKSSTPDYLNLKVWPEHSVGSYLEKMSRVSKPRKFAWDLDSVSSNLTPEGLSRLYHQLVLVLPINPLDEMLERFDTVAEVRSR